LFSVFRTFVKRHQGKKVSVKIDGTSLEMTGYSKHQADQLMRTAMEIREQSKRPPRPDEGDKGTAGE
jgi:hypothetical protein